MDRPWTAPFIAHGWSLLFIAVAARTARAGLTPDAAATAR